MLPLKYVDDLFGPCARESIKTNEAGGVILLENARFYSEENVEKVPRSRRRPFLVKYLRASLLAFM
jgi:phosphoglycerate kinase